MIKIETHVLEMTTDVQASISWLYVYGHTWVIHMFITMPGLDRAANWGYLYNAADIYQFNDSLGKINSR